MVQEKDGTLWISSWLDGAVRIKGEEYKLFTQADGFMHAVITNMYIGKDGTVWFTTYNGLSYYSEKK